MYYVYLPLILELCNTFSFKIRHNWQIYPIRQDALYGFAYVWGGFFFIWEYEYTVVEEGVHADGVSIYMPTTVLMFNTNKNNMLVNEKTITL